jgi:NhaP-type Na+/H+ or K+/H+ antiporter
MASFSLHRLCSSRRASPSVLRDLVWSSSHSTITPYSCSVLFMGWFGPRGLASIVLGLIVVAEAPLLAGREEIELVVALTVLLSVQLRGLTAAPLSAAYARRVDGMAADVPEKGEAVEVPIRTGPVPATKPEKADET